MASTRPLKVGLVGKRAVGALRCFKALDETEVAAICTQHEETVRPIAAEYDVPNAYTRYEDLLESDVDIVFLGTPLPEHVRQSVAALEAGKHVICEIPAAGTLEECWELLEAVRRAGTKYMLAENYIYMREHVLVRELVRQGLFGEVYYAEGEYIHEAKGAMFDARGQPTWKHYWFVGRRGANYATHALGPILDWFDERVATVSCFGTGRRTAPQHVMDDTTLMICHTPSGRLIKIRNDLLSNAPPRKYYILHGTKGLYESNRRTVWGSDGTVSSYNRGEGEGVADEFHQAWLSDLHGDPPRFHPLSGLESYLPQPMHNPPPEGIHVGHSGGDYWQVRAFVDSIIEDTTPPLDIYRALEMTAPGLCAGTSMEKGGIPVDVPDFRGS